MSSIGLPFAAAWPHVTVAVALPGRRLRRRRRARHADDVHGQLPGRLPGIGVARVADRVGDVQRAEEVGRRCHRHRCRRRSPTRSPSRPLRPPTITCSPCPSGSTSFVSTSTVVLVVWVMRTSSATAIGGGDWFGVTVTVSVADACAPAASVTVNGTADRAAAGIDRGGDGHGRTVEGDARVGGADSERQRVAGGLVGVADERAQADRAGRAGLDVGRTVGGDGWPVGRGEHVDGDRRGHDVAVLVVGAEREPGGAGEPAVGRERHRQLPAGRHVGARRAPAYAVAAGEEDDVAVGVADRGCRCRSSTGSPAFDDGADRVDGRGEVGVDDHGEHGARRQPVRVGDGVGVLRAGLRRR